MAKGRIECRSWNITSDRGWERVGARLVRSEKCGLVKRLENPDKVG